MASSQRQTVQVDGRKLQLSNLDKVLYPSTGTTKRDVLDYLGAIAPVMIPHCRGRAATRKRWPNGVGEDGSGQMFFQKDIGEGAPDWVEVRSIQHSDHVNTYPLVNDRATLTWLGQLASLEIHVPQWRFGRGNEKLNPDRLVLDLDPGKGVTLRECADVARLARSILHDMGLSVVPVTSGSKGIHLYAALDGSQTSDQVSKVARELARSLEADYPDEIISSMKRSARAGKVFIDWSQNNASKTTIAPYSLRGRSTPMVAAPRTWGELASPHLKHLDFREVLKRVKRRGDPMAEITGDDDEETARDRLTVYRSKRTQGKTPEPIPDAVASGARDKPTFVIQEHHARRLHYDFRLEHDGVLVSWALPKGVPTVPKRNHLAVPTEDHPLEYGSFEGRIPKGEYGAGVVEIWDSGTIDVDTWSDGKVVATLHGSPGGGLGGERTFALFRTKDDPDKPQWMIHVMDEKKAQKHHAESSSDGRSRSNTSRSPSRSLRPMLATRGTASQISGPSATEWAFEMKWDGMRALIRIDGDDVRLTSRAGHDVTRSYPEFSDASDDVDADSCVLDAELVALDDSGRPDFGRMQQRMNVSKPRDVERARSRVPVTAMVFDVLDINGNATTSLPYVDRRELLSETIDVDAARTLFVPPAFDGDIDAAIAASRERNLEGVMAKRRDSTYTPGARSREWLKLPHAEASEVVVIGWRPSDADPDGFASLLLAIPGDDGLHYAGRVGTGFSTRDRRTIRSELAKMARKTPPVSDVPPADARDAHWVTPRRVAEVRYREITADHRLRHPTWRGWRPDKEIDDISPPGA
ncbi:ATP-dependent DNA ligase [Paramicrobacterium agarici]|uniref:ATP-dependent DNA ligase n=1 Tax=Paramicrobacterium agarici TaxID=630514 RepID=UPI00115038B4|nr:ATP-dependent DNA ligase [Microbacterium agarici]TQO24188.1 ATP-dependent DNA ligase LigD ligase module /ATP-dependent DNA ligase LigD phosphoesterase module /ATP-dependent DNA ligase LigD polymerase module [Microbacterium agarici]